MLKATTTEKNGVISCTLEETNRIRAELGLKPLKPRVKQPSAASSALSTQHSTDKNTQALAGRIAAARTARSASAWATEGASLGQSLVSGTSGESAKDWLKSAGARAAASKSVAAARALQASSGEPEEDGMEVAVDLDQLESGEQVTLTLADSSVLDAGSGTNVLTHDDMARSARGQARASKSARLAASAYTSAAGLAGPSDSEEEAKPAGRLTSRGYTASAETVERRLAKAAAAARPGARIASSELAGDAGVAYVASDYMTEAEAVAAFGKRAMKGRTKASTKQKARAAKRRAAVQDDDGEEEGGGTSLLAELNASAAAKAVHRSRGAQSAAAQSASQTEAERRAVYEHAVDQASAKPGAGFMPVSAMPTAPGPRQSAALATLAGRGFVASTTARAGVKRRAAQVVAADSDSDDADLRQSQQQMAALRRRMAAAQASDSAAQASSGADEAAQLLARAAAARAAAAKADASEKSKSSKLVFSSVSSVARRVRGQQQEGKSDLSGAGAAEQPAAAAAAASAPAAAALGTARQGTEYKQDAPEVDMDADSSPGTEQPLTDVPIKEQNVTRSSGAALAAFREMGLLNKPAKETAEFEDGVRLEYKDEFGNDLSIKDAWKQLNYQMHGQKPGRRAQEKRLKRLAEAAEAKKERAGLIDAQKAAASKARTAFIHFDPTKMK